MITCIINPNKDNNAKYIILNEELIPLKEETRISFRDYLNLINKGFEISVISVEYVQNNESKVLNYFMDIDDYTGYGRCSYYLTKHSILKGYDVGVYGNIFNKEFSNLKNKEIKYFNNLIIHKQPKNWNLDFFKKKIIILPFETTKIPQSWIEYINKNIDLVLTTCKQNVEAFLNSGLKKPIDDIRWGVDTDKFSYIERKNSVLTFGQFGALSIRKGTDLIIKAFRDAFPDKKDVKLLLKTSHNFFQFDTYNDKRIEVHIGEMEEDELFRKIISKIDVFLWPSRGEGAGLPPLEMAATGIPVVYTNWSGMVDYLSPEIGYPIEYKLVPAKEFSENIYKEDCGEWAEPNYDDLVYTMRYIYDNPEKAKLKGLNGVNYVLNNFTWERSLEKYFKILKDFLYN